MPPSRTQRLLHGVWIATLLVVAAKAGLCLVRMVEFEARDLLNGDALIYLTMGRGILNGLRPYTDLFESKPPGIFFLAALSLLLTRGTLLLRLLEAAGLVSLPASCVIAWWERGRESSLLSLTVLAMAVVGGTLLALRTQENAGGLQSEVFGVLPCTLYALTVTTFAARTGWRWTALRGLCLLGTLAIREPYVLGLLAAALLAARGLRELWTLFLLPLRLVRRDRLPLNVCGSSGRSFCSHCCWRAPPAVSCCSFWACSGPTPWCTYPAWWGTGSAAVRLTPFPGGSCGCTGSSAP
jgi:hypothetical protein